MTELNTPTITVENESVPPCSGFDVGVLANVLSPYDSTMNFMGGTSFKLNPLHTLRIVSTSMICGENMYYRANKNGVDLGRSIESSGNSTAQLPDYTLFPELYSVAEENSEDYFTQIIGKALEYDFGGTLDFIGQLRNDYYMRLNSHALVVSAIHHPARGKFNLEHPNKMKDAIRAACLIPTDWTTQFQLLKASKRPIPTIWKKSIAGLLEKMTAYHASKYIHGSKSGNSTGTPNAKKAPYTKPQKIKGRNGKMYYPKKTPPSVVDPLLPSEETPKIDKMSLANLVDLVRLTHPKSTPVIDELVKNGKVSVSDDAQTWEKLRSANKTWFEITEQIRMPHMALLRNLRNIATEFENVISGGEDVEEVSEEGLPSEDDPQTPTVVRSPAPRSPADPLVVEKYYQRANDLAKLLVSGVKNGKQFPFRYYSAYKMLTPHESNDESNSWGEPPDDISVEDQSTEEDYAKPNTITGVFVNALENCLLESLDTIPAMKGRVDCLTDNSGSSRTGMVSEYGTTNIYEIANLSSILTAYRSTEGGSVWIFGDRLKEYPVSHDKPIMKQLTEINRIGNRIGQCTETGVWLFWDMAIRTNKKLDTVFIYSDMQAGHGGLYASDDQHQQLNACGAKLTRTGHIDVLCLVKEYRQSIYSKVNVFSVQVAGYDNSIMPDILYRGAVLSGWTGKEAKLAYEMNKVWDEAEFNNS